MDSAASHPAQQQDDSNTPLYSSLPRNCGTCDLSVSWKQRGVACDNCNQWYHADCQSIGSSYENLDKSEVVWVCLVCGMNNHSTTVFDLHGPDASSSSHSLSDLMNGSTPNEPFKPLHSSTPTRISKQCRQLNRPLRLVNINYHSIVGKIAENFTMLGCTKPDILIATETWVDGDIQDSQIFPSTYKLHRNDRNRYGGGVLIATAQDLVCTRARELETDCEMVWVRVKVRGQRSLYICAFYRPDDGDAPSLDRLHESLERAAAIQNAVIIVGGDFNLPGWNWSTSELKPKCPYPSLHRRFLSTVQEFGMEQIVEFPTRLENTLDLMLTTHPNLVPRVEPLPGLSDHEAVYMEFQISEHRQRQPPRTISLYNKADWKAMKTEAQEISSNLITTYAGRETEHGTVEELWTDFREGLQNLVHKSVPTKIARPKPSLPWITPEIKKMIRRRNRLYRKWKKSGRADLHDTVRRLKHETQRCIRKAYWKHMQSLFVDSTSSKDHQPPTKRFWAHVKSMRSGNMGVSPLKENGKLVTDPTLQAEMLNRQFQSAFSPSTVFTEEEFHQKCPMQPVRLTETLEEITITEEGVRKLLRNLKPNKASGPDGISPRVLQELADELTPALTLLFNLSLQSGTIPRDWRSAFVTPVFKKGERYRPENYRPISLTSVVCKAMEHIVVSHLMQHAESNNILAPEQHGFRRGRSCETQLLGLFDEATEDLQAGKQVDLVVMDFAKAFDKVNHSLLIHKLSHYGVIGKINTWIRNFLLDRQQAVVVEGARSSFIPVESGVPQGSVLGPVLFLLFINDLPQQIESTARLFADDTACQKSVSKDSDQESMQSDINQLAQWEDRWNMKFHPDKCQLLRMRKAKKGFDQQYTLHGHTLEQVGRAKYLGVHLSDDALWESHINAITTKANRMLGLLRRTLKISYKSVKEQAYKALVRPILEFASPVWDPHTVKLTKSLEAIQRRAARWVTQRYRQTSSVDDMLASLSWPTLQTRRKRARLVMFHKYHHGLVHIDSPYCPSPHPPGRRRVRHTHSLAYPVKPCRTDYRKFSYFPRTIPEWNALPEDAVTAPTLTSFRSRLDGCLAPDRPSLPE